MFSEPMREKAPIDHRADHDRCAGPRAGTRSICRNISPASMLHATKMPARRSFVAGLLVACATAGAPKANATDWYVSGTGNDKNSGLSEAAPFRTLQAAANALSPGDQVLVLDGVYSTNPNIWNNAVLTLSKSGDPEHQTVFRAYPGAHPIISTAGNAKNWFTVLITASYITFEGFEIVGSAQYVTLAEAEAAYAKERNVGATDNLTNSTGIYIQKATHVSIIDNLIHDICGAGISAQFTDYVEIRQNIVFNTSWWTALDTSGIGFQFGLNSDNYTGYKNFIIDNISHDNGNTVPYWLDSNGGGVPTDGNGIIIDTNSKTYSAATNGAVNVPYTGRTLVAGNLLYNNGGSGAHSYNSGHVDFFNNTAYMNNKCPYPGATCGNINEGQLFASMSNDVNIYNNILFSPAGKHVYFYWQDTNVSENNNVMFSQEGAITYGGSEKFVLGNKDAIADPMFNNPDIADVVSATPEGDKNELLQPAHAEQDLEVLYQSSACGTGAETMSNGAAIYTDELNLPAFPTYQLGIGALIACVAR